MPEHAVRAFSALDGSIFHGRMLHLLPGKAKDDAENDANDGNNCNKQSRRQSLIRNIYLIGTTNFKAKKEQKLKARSGSAHNWNSLFLGHNSVAEVIADTYRTSKENVLDPHGDGNAAVRLALGETQIVTETRKYLEREGVVLEAFSQVRSAMQTRTCSRYRFRCFFFISARNEAVEVGDFGEKFTGQHPPEGTARPVFPSRIDRQDRPASERHYR